MQHHLWYNINVGGDYVPQATVGGQMPRKSQELRLQQTIELIDQYQSVGAVNNTAFRFLQDISCRMSRGKYPTKRQREWLDRLITEGAPVPTKPSEAYEKMKSARDIFIAGQKDWEAGVLGDFMQRETKGWSLSVKQAALLEKLFVKADSLAAGTYFMDVTADQRIELEMAVKLYNSYSQAWRGDRPALYRAVNQVQKFLSGEGNIEQYHYDKLMTSLASKIRTVKNPRFFVGDAGFFRLHSRKDKVMILCASDMYVTESGQVVNDWVLPSGELTAISQNRVTKR